MTRHLTSVLIDGYEWFLRTPAPAEPPASPSPALEVPAVGRRAEETGTP